MSDEATLGVLTLTKRAKDKEKQEYLKRYRKTHNREPLEEKILGVTEEDLNSTQEEEKKGSKVEQVKEEAAQAVSKAVDIAKEQVKSKTIAAIRGVILRNPYVIAAIIIIIIVVIIIIIIYTQVNDNTGGIVKTLCVKLDDCVKLMLDKGGGALQNAN